MPDSHQPIELKKLVASPTNPRKHFDEEALQALARSLNNAGMIQPIIVRSQFAGTYEIVAGERRFRAAKIAKLKTVPCIIRDLSDDEVIEVQLLENLEREDLNAIEEAESFLKLTTDGGFTQRELAERLSRSQAHVANRIRLLDLPEAWQKKVISQEIPATHARALVPYAKYPAIVKEVESGLAAEMKFDGILPNVEAFEGLIIDAVLEITASMTKASKARPWMSSRECQFKVTPEIEAELDIIEIPARYGKKGATEKRALNVKRWQELQDQAIAANKSKASKKFDQDSAKSPKLTAAEQREKAKKLAEQFRQRVANWLTGFKQQRILALLSGASFDVVWKLMIFFSCRSNLNGRLDSLWTEIKERGGKGPNCENYERHHHTWGALSSLKTKDMPNIAASLVKQWVSLSDFEGWNSDLQASDIHAMYAELGGDLERDWVQAQSEVRLEYLELHNREQLLDLALSEPYAKHIKKSTKPTRQDLERLKRGDLIQFIHSNCSQPDCPPALLKLK